VDDRERLAGYLAVIGAAGDGDRAGQGQPELRRGQFHDVVLAGEVAYRFPRDEESRRVLPGRVALLRVLAGGRLPAATPVPLSTACAGPRHALGRCHVALTRLPGQPLARERAVSPRSAPAVIGELGELMDALTGLGNDPAVRGAVPGPDPGRWARFAAEVTRVLFPLMSDRGRQRAAAELARVMAVDPAGTALVHGDLGGTNLLWTGSQDAPRLAGVLDWDEAHIGSQAEDLASLAVTFGRDLAGRLDAGRAAAAHGELGDARAIAATFALQQALPAALSGDRAMPADGLAGYVS